MDIFYSPSTYGLKALIENHFWKHEFTMESSDLYSTFTESGHSLLAVNKGNLVCVYSSVLKYKLRSSSSLIIHPEYSLGNDTHSFQVKIVDYGEERSDDEDTIYECYDSSSVVCQPAHRLFFNSIILRSFDWNALKLDVDFKLLNLDSTKFNSPYYLVKKTPFTQLLCNTTTAPSACKHQRKRLTNISGGYKQLLFDVTTDKSFSCSCSLFSYLSRTYSQNKFNYVLMSYKLTQLFLYF
jgi:hypothetical protein